ncbi:NodT family efflux transporter outer membrane factor (OMF) lipoprotein [Novosphingobium chloroacetimidivorans]|uniref:NodT family efflux transporter outer membrane factor (OMF) lipoprotein n=1 Tax=Novosphingobium chloroacetimidivorans TaxID=1428314 RepID=A0A7W7KDZ6_9SPHN|nr:TolC family protein [Novosphingobium chloroacetimidivorans]MBB4860499.1 NodT family efflux transporter outer membrane factor (OMF) lipoprotein [Novosphingobium chloroacetimidivorans]
MFKRAIASLLAATSLAACAVGPNYVAKAPPPSAQAPFIGGAAPVVSTAEPDATWWRLYNDSALDQLVQDALAANTDIRVAVARIERARAELRGSRNLALPQTGIEASGGQQRTSRFQSLPGLDRENRVVDGEFNVSYEVDLFGRVKRGVEASRADLAAAQQDADAVRVTVVADTVRAYVDATSAAEQIAVAQRTVDLLQRSERIVNARAERGLNQRLDVIRITQLREQQSASIPALQASREGALFRLATLTGRTPQDLPAAASARTDTPDVSQPIPVGDGRMLLARRPDVKAAERRLAADTARIGVATADLYPRISLGGTIGTTALGSTDVFGGGPLRWLLGPLISWAFPNQAGIRSRIAVARADTQADLAAFDGTVLTALEETETALSVYRNALLRKDRLASARNAAQRAANVGLARQSRGQTDALDVLDAQRVLAQSEAEYAAAVRAVAFAQVDLFRALGGSWQNPQVARAPQSSGQIGS